MRKQKPESSKDQLQFLCVSLAVLELTLYTRLVWNSEICLPLGVHNQGGTNVLNEITTEAC